MKTKILIFLFFTIATSVFATNEFSSQGQSDPWTQQQLLAPADLAKVLNDPKAPKPLVYSIGMQAIIKGSVDIGPTMRPENLNTLKEKLNKLKEELDKPPYVSMQQESTSFINKISIIVPIDEGNNI